MDGVYRNRRDAILGADDKAGVAVLIEAARRWSATGAPCDIRARLHDRGGGRAARGPGIRRFGALEAELGFVLDHAAPIGRMVVAAPT